MTIHLSELWDYNQPELSEQRFRAALAGASEEDALIFQTQIARTYGLRQKFHEAHQILAEIEPRIHNAGAEAQVHYYLELGRAILSAAHPPEAYTPEARELARAAYLRAFDLAQAAGLDALAIDALHMMTVVDTAPEDQVAWNLKAIALMQTSAQPDALHWEGSLRNNLGYAYHLLERYPEALAEFQQSLAAYERAGRPGPMRIARWMIAWTLRAMGRLNEALAIQLRLEQEWDAAGEPDPYVFEELEHLYRALNDTERAEFYAGRRKAVG